MGVKEAAGKGAWRKRYLKEYRPPSVLAHLVAQPSRHAQRMIAAVGMEASGARKALVGWEKGGTIESLGGTRFLLRNRRAVLDQLAGAVADHLRLGLVHGDIHSENVVVSRGFGRRPVKVKLIDYATAKPLTGKTMRNYEKTYGFMRRQFGKAVERGEIREELAREYLEEIRAERKITDDYSSVIDYVIPSLARDMKDRAALKSYFERKFLEKVRKKL